VLPLYCYAGAALAIALALTLSFKLRQIEGTYFVYLICPLYTEEGGKLIIYKF
jgi:hypothetical protein